MSADTETPLKSVPQLAKLFGVGTATVYNGCNNPDPAKRWPHLVIAGKFRFAASHIERIQALLVPPDAAELTGQDAQVIPIDRLVRSARRRAA